MTPKDKIQLQIQISETVKFYQGMILDTFEVELGDDPKRWQYVRSRLLNIMGDRGLMGKLKKVLEVES